MVLNPENVADVIKSKSKQLRLSAQQLAKSHPSREEIRVKIKEIWRHVQIMDEAFKKCRRLLNESDHAPLVFKLEHSRKELMRSRKGHAKAIRASSAVETICRFRRSLLGNQKSVGRLSATDWATDGAIDLRRPSSCSPVKLSSGTQRFWRL